MLGLFKRLFGRRDKGPDLSLWPYPLGESDLRHLMSYAVGIANVTMPARLDYVVELLGPNPLESRVRPARKGALMTPDDLSSFGLNRRLKLSADFFLCLTPEAQKNPLAAEKKLIRHSITAIGNRRELNRMVQTLGPKQVVEFVRDKDSCCPQARSFDGKTWASVAPDLPLPGCSADMCMCDNRAVIEF